MEPRQPPDEPRREHRRDPRGRRSQLHDARRCAARALRHRLRRARRRQDLARLHAAGADLHRRAGRRAQPARGVPAARDGDAAQPLPRVDRRAVARRRVRLGRSRRPGRGGADGVGGRARQPHGERRLRGDVHGRGPRSVGRGIVAGGLCRRRSLGRSGREQARRGTADCARVGRDCLGGGRRRALCPLRPLPLGARDQQHCARGRRALRIRRRLLRGDLGGRAGRLGHGHERRRGRLDRRRGRRSRRDRGALVGAARRPLHELAAGLRRDHARRARRDGRSPSPALPQQREHPAGEAARPARAAADRPAHARAPRPGRRPGAARHREDLRGPRRPGRLAGLARGAHPLARGGGGPDRLRRRGLRSAGVRLDAELPRRRARLALGRAALRPRRGPLHAGALLRRRPSASSAASTGSCSGTRTR